MEIFAGIDPGHPILLAGPTASGKSALALRLARQLNATIVNADALQVYCCWKILTARPTDAEMAEIPHRLYGHIKCDHAYSVGQWVRDIEALLAENSNGPLIITGGTGLYFSAVTNGLADIPKVDDEVKNMANFRLSSEGTVGMLAELESRDHKTFARIDTQNPVRVSRAWQVLIATGRGLADWQDDTPAPLVPLRPGNAFVLKSPKTDLIHRIDQRFDKMIAQGALEECRANLAGWDPDHPSAKAIGAAELMAYLRGETTLETAIDAAKILTHQYAKRQRTWFRSRMKSWTWIDATGALVGI